MNGQRVSNAVSAIHRTLGLQLSCAHTPVGCQSDCPHLADQASCTELFNTLNYSDDFAGAEVLFTRSNLSFNTMGTLLDVLHLTESIPKAISPCQVMIYLGI